MNDNVKLALYRFRYAIILLAVVLGPDRPVRGADRGVVRHHGRAAD